MKFKQARLWSSLVVATVLWTSFPSTGEAKKHSESEEQVEAIPTAVVTGLAGETYVFYGTGGITVDETPRPGMWHSNLKTYKIRIDGSTISGNNAPAAAGGLATSNFAAATVETDFQAFPNTAYFVSNSATCTLPSGSGAAGREIVVCNNSKSGTVTYNTASGETVSGNASGTLTNATPYKVDRFISDGKNWYRE
jgi:hypothetical protein